MAEVNAHARRCANCQHVGDLPDGAMWCCWNPIGCECVARLALLGHVDCDRGCRERRAASSESRFTS